MKGCTSSLSGYSGCSGEGKRGGGAGVGGGAGLRRGPGETQFGNGLERERKSAGAGRSRFPSRQGCGISSGGWGRRPAEMKLV